MTPDRWKDTVAMVKEKFPGAKFGQEPYDDGPGEVEFLEFQGPMGEIRLEFITRPVVIGKHGIGGKKVGAATGVHYDYSADEDTYRIEAYKRVNGEWESIDSSAWAS